MISINITALPNLKAASPVHTALDLNDPVEGAEVVTLQLVSKERFGAASRYKEELIGEYKQHTDDWDSKWDTGLRLWTFDLGAYEVNSSSRL